MADGGLKLELDAALSERVKTAAEAEGARPEEMAAKLIQRGLEADWAEDFARVAEFDAAGEAIPADQYVAELRAAVDARFAEGAIRP